jgi:hypothetical protein
LAILSANRLVLALHDPECGEPVIDSTRCFPEVVGSVDSVLPKLPVVGAIQSKAKNLAAALRIQGLSVGCIPIQEVPSQVSERHLQVYYGLAVFGKAVRISLES